MPIVAILSRYCNLKTKKRVDVIMMSRKQNGGSWQYRLMGLRLTLFPRGEGEGRSVQPKERGAWSISCHAQVTCPTSQDYIWPSLRCRVELHSQRSPPHSSFARWMSAWLWMLARSPPPSIHLPLTSRKVPDGTTKKSANTGVTQNRRFTNAPSIDVRPGQKQLRTFRAYHHPLKRRLSPSIA